VGAARRLAFAGLLVAGAVVGRAAQEKPNLLVFLIDDLGWVDISAGASNYGNPSDFYETPTVERLAARGMSFTSAYVQPNCAPTRGALLSGQYPTRTRVYNVGNLNRGTGSLLGPEQHEDIMPSAITVAETLKTAGYTTAHVGKYHVGGHEGGSATLPLNQGFDFNFGGGDDGAPGNYFAQEVTSGVWQFGNRIGPELDPYAAPYTAAYVAEHGLPSSLIGTAKHVTDAATDAALDFMHDRVQAAEPFYLQLHHFAIHSPNQGRPDLVSKYTAKKAATPSQMGHDNVQVAALIEGFDQSLDRIIDFLDDPDGDGNPADSIAADTLLVFHSDNGGDGRTNNAPLRGNKGMLTEGGIRVPLIVSMPGTIAPGTVNDTMLHAVDFYTTLADFAGAVLPDPQLHPLDGVSLAPVLRGESATVDRDAIFYHFPGYLDTRAAPTSVILKEVDGIRYKLYYFYEDRHTELYDLTNDIGETVDLLVTPPGDPEEIYDFEFQLLTELRAWLDRTGAIYPIDPGTGEEVAPPEPVERPDPPPPPPALVYEGFELSEGVLAGRGSGFGWEPGSVWQETSFNNVYYARRAGLSFPGLFSTGTTAQRQSYEGRGAVSRPVGSDELAQLTSGGGELWLSVLIRNQDSSSTFESMLFLLSSVRLQDNDGSVTHLKNYDLGSGLAAGFVFDVNENFGPAAIRGVVFDGDPGSNGSGQPRVSSGGFAIASQSLVHLVAVRIRWAETTQEHEVTLWALTGGANPSYAAPVPLGEPVATLTFAMDQSRLRFITFGGRRWAAADEVRLGLSAQDVGVRLPGDALFRRGDANRDGSVNLADAVYILQYLFSGGPSVRCPDAGDANDDEGVDISDAVYIVQYLFTMGSPIPLPYPACGTDPTPHPQGGPDLRACDYCADACEEPPVACAAR
jgi:arylsulfatase A-like enzyme